MKKTSDGIEDTDISFVEREIEKYGIVRVPTEIYQYKEFRYPNLIDALQQAKRDERV